jgi:hypothetical protein
VYAISVMDAYSVAARKAASRTFKRGESSVAGS